MATTRELEGSKHKSRPVEFYHFYQTTHDWYYTTSRRVKTLGGIPHQPLEITRGQIDMGGEDRPGALSITVPTDSSIGSVLQEGSGATPISLRITRQQPSASDDPWIIFIGEISGANVQGEIVNIDCLPFTARLDLIVPQGLYQRDQCQWNTYDPYTCKKNRSEYTFVGTVTGVDGLRITVDGASAFDPGTGVRDDMFAGGVLEKGERTGMIESQDGDTVTLLELVPTVAVDDVIFLVAGDDRLLDTCRDKFNNAQRRVAFPHLPLKNPWYGQGLR